MRTLSIFYVNFYIKFCNKTYFKFYFLIFSYDLQGQGIIKKKKKEDKYSLKSIVKF